MSTGFCTIYIDGVGVKVNKSYDLWTGCRLARYPLPGFCWYNGLRAESCAGFCAVYCCRERKVKYSCRMRIIPGMNVMTKHPELDVVRSNILKLLIEAHPLECPVCPQNGQCVLQDFALEHPAFCGKQTAPLPRSHVYGGVFLSTSVHRCVGCGLCARFSEEVVGAHALLMGTTETGVRLTSIGHEDAPSVFSGNLGDLCPVGVFLDIGRVCGLHSSALHRVKSIDTHDGCGTPVDVVVARNKVVRVEPRKTEEGYRWISDKVRFSYDALNSNSLEAPLVRVREQTLVFSWQKTLDTLARSLEKAGLDKMAIFVGASVDLETLWVLSRLMKSCGITHIDSHQRKLPQALTHYSGRYTFGGDFERLFDADAIVLVGVRPVYEAPILHTLLVRHYNKNRVPIVALSVDFFMPYGDNLGPYSLHIQQMLNGSSPYQHCLENAQRPLFICGYDAFSGKHGDLVLNGVMSLAERYTRAKGWNGIAFVPPHMSFIGCHDLKLFPKTTQHLSGYGIAQSLNKGFMKSVLLLGYEGVHPPAFGRALCVYQGSFATNVSKFAHITLPEYAHTEKTGTYVNAEGHLRTAYKATKPCEKMRDGVWILQELLRRLDGDYYPRERSDITKECVDFYKENFGENGEKRTYSQPSAEPVRLPAETWVTSLQDFYLSDSLSMSSHRLRYAAQRVNWERGRQGVW